MVPQESTIGAGNSGERLATQAQTCVVAAKGGAVMSIEETMELARTIVCDALREVGRKGTVHVFQDDDCGRAVFTVAVNLGGNKSWTQFSQEELTGRIAEARTRARAFVTVLMVDAQELSH